MKARSVRSRGLLLLLAALAACGSGASGQGVPQRRNVLFLVVDDLRPQLGCYGDALARSPHIDALARRGTVFSRAYCQQAVCSPSRTSVLTGRRPDTTRVYDLETHFRTTIPDVVTLPQHFRAYGYVTAGVGKVYHGGLDDPASWSRPSFTPRRRAYGPAGQEVLTRLRAEAAKRGEDPDDARARVRGPAWEAPDVADGDLPDGAIADRAIELLQEWKDRPFFLAVGFLKPHLPFVAPRVYWEMHDPNRLPYPSRIDPPEGAPSYAPGTWGELRNYHGIPRKGPLTRTQARSLIHGYYACVSYVDAQVGRVLAELDRLGLVRNTVVVLWGDHGWQLGENGMWCKHTNYELSTRSPLIVSSPDGRGAGNRCDALVEFVDIFPTVTELCGLPAPAGLEGVGLAPLLENSSRRWKSAVFSQYPRQVPGKGRLMGRAIRTDRYRLVEWSNTDRSFRELELYDHVTDPGEAKNRANDPACAGVVRELSERLAQGWRGNLPPGRANATRR